MAAGFTLKLLIVSSVFMAYCDANTFLTEMNDSTKELIEKARPSKHPRCFTPNQLKCDTTEYPDYNFDLTRWYYNATLKVCLPIFVDGGQNKVCPGIVDWVIELPYTKKECEDLCGEPCFLVHSNHKSEEGICMMDCAIPRPKGSPLQCLPFHFGCCPRDYEPPKIYTHEPMYVTKAALLNMSESMMGSMVPNLNVTMEIMGYYRE